MSSTIADLDQLTLKYLEKFDFRKGFNCIWTPQRRGQGTCKRSHSVLDFKGNGDMVYDILWDKVRKQCAEIYHAARAGNNAETVKHIHGLARILACGIHNRIRSGSQLDMKMETYAKHELLPLVMDIQRDLGTAMLATQGQTTPGSSAAWPVHQPPCQALDRFSDSNEDSFDDNLRKALQRPMASENQQHIDPFNTGSWGGMVPPGTRAHSVSAGSNVSWPIDQAANQAPEQLFGPDEDGFNDIFRESSKPTVSSEDASTTDCGPVPTHIGVHSISAGSPGDFSLELDLLIAQNPASDTSTTQDSASTSLDSTTQDSASTSLDEIPYQSAAHLPFKMSDYDMVCSECGAATSNVMHYPTLCETGEPTLRKDVCDGGGCLRFGHDWLHAMTCSTVAV